MIQDPYQTQPRGMLSSGLRLGSSGSSVTGRLMLHGQFLPSVSTLSWTSMAATVRGLSRISGEEWNRRGAYLGFVRQSSFYYRMGMLGFLFPIGKQKYGVSGSSTVLCASNAGDISCTPKDAGLHLGTGVHVGRSKEPGNQ